jgi:hypothetical protein
MYYFRGTASHIMIAPKDNDLSGWQTLPFAWSFYGQNVRGFYISDNGYITFDSAATVSNASNTALSDNTVQKNAIYAHWNDYFLEVGHGSWSNEVATATIYAAPSRTFVIYWMSVIPAGSNYNSSHVSFCIALHEAGGFDILYSVGVFPTAPTGTVGAIDKNGLEYITTPESPAHPFPTVGVGSTDDFVFLFKRPTGIHDQSIYKQFDANYSYGNKPSLVVRASEKCNLKLEIFTLNGQSTSKTMEWNQLPGTSYIELESIISGLPAGMYMAKLTSEGYYCMVKIIK